MKTVKSILVFVLTAIAVFFAKGQVPGNINETNFFKTKFTKNYAWDVQRDPAFPVAGQDWRLTGLTDPLESNGTKINWGAGRYLILVPEIDNTNNANSLLDDVYNKGTKYALTLKLYERNGKLVKVVSKWGRILGKGTNGFMYEAEGFYGTFFSINPLNSSSVVTYKPTSAVVTKLSELINENEMPKPSGAIAGKKLTTKEEPQDQKDKSKNVRVTQTDTKKAKEEPVQPQSQIAVGYYTLTARCSGLVLDVLDASTKDGARIQQWKLNGNIAQHWKIEPVQGAPGYYILTARCSGKVLDVLDASTKDGAKIQQWSLNGNIAQHWKIDPVQGAPGYYILTARCSGKVLDVLDASTKPGATIQQWSLNGNIAQHWKLDLVK